MDYAHHGSRGSRPLLCFRYMQSLLLALVHKYIIKANRVSDSPSFIGKHQQILTVSHSRSTPATRHSKELHVRHATVALHPLCNKIQTTLTNVSPEIRGSGIGKHHPIIQDGSELQAAHTITSPSVRITNAFRTRTQQKSAHNMLGWSFA